MDRPFRPPPDWLAAYLGVSARTVRRWYATDCLPPGAALAVRAVFGGDLGALSPHWRGWELQDDGLVTPGGTAIARNRVAGIDWYDATLRALKRECEQARAQAPLDAAMRAHLARTLQALETLTDAAGDARRELVPLLDRRQAVK